MSIRSWARRAGLGVLAYRTVHAPRAFARKCAREGPVNLWLCGRGRRAMEAAARSLPPAGPAPGPAAPTIHFLTGAKFWYQTAFCGYSFVRHAGTAVRVVLVDDGTLTDANVEALGRVLPGVEVHRSTAVLARLDEFLPTARFPCLRGRRLVYPHLRKLTDVHAGGSGWKLVLDSDMLFFRRPAFLLGWLAGPDRPLYMQDVENAYGYTPELLAELAGGAVPDRVNVGACGLRSDAVDWDRLEHWCRITLEREGSHYLQEQALTAMLMAGRPTAVAPAADYVVRPTRAEAMAPTAALHHYVAESKAWYFRYGWRHVTTSEGSVK